MPSNLELAADAQTVVLATVVAGALDEGGDPFESTITIHPLEAIKGPLPKRDLALYGDLGEPVVALADGRRRV